MPGLLQIHLLGQYSVRYNNRPLTTLDADRIRSLLTWLLLLRGAPVRRQELAFRLWPDTSEQQARTNLRNLLYQLRAALPEPDRYLETTRHTIAWRKAGPYTLDVAEFEHALHAAQQLLAAGAPSRQQALERAVQLYSGELLPDGYDEWLEPHRERLRSAYAQALQSLVVIAEEAGAWQTALCWAEQLRGHDPLNEATYSQLMRLHAYSGNQQAIEQTYQRCAQLLQDELKVGPSAATRTSYQHWRDHAAKAALQQPKLERQVASAQRSRLPALPSALIGRSAELEQLNSMVADQAVRLVTITGPGGVGKTSLALTLAQQLIDSGHVLSFIALTPLESVDQLLAAIATALGGIPDQQRVLLAQVANLLQAQPHILVLDNAEHLLDSAAVIAELLEQAPATTILVTSRRRLQLRDEWVFRLTGLPTPAHTASDDPAAYSAIQLFVQSAQRATRQFQLTAHNQTAVVQICQLVAGLPLGLELAAAWTHMLEPAAIVQEIISNLDFLASTARDLPTRHRSLRAVFEHSWQLLADQERLCLARLTVFRGAFTRQSAAAVAAASLQLLSLLVDASLVHRTAHSRYDLHPLIRQYAAQQLQALAHEQDTTQARFIEHYTEMLAEWEQPLCQHHDRQALAAIRDEIDNLRQWIDWALALRRYSDIQRGAETLAHFYEAVGWIPEGQQRFSAAVQQLELLEHSSEWSELDDQQHQQIQHTRCLLLAKQATFEQLIGDIAQLRATLTALSTLAERCAAPQWQSDVLRIWGTALRYLGKDAQECEQVLEQAIAGYTATGDVLNTIRSMFMLADLHTHHARTAAALHYLERGLALNRQLGSSYMQALLLSGMGVACVHQQHTQQQAAHYFKEALERFRSIDDALGILRTANNLGMLYCWMGYPHDGLVYLQEARSYAQRCQSFMEHTGVLDSLASTYFVLERYSEAHTAWVEALSSAERQGWLLGQGWACNGLGRIALALGDYAVAQRYLAQAVEHMQASGEPREIARCCGDLGRLYARTDQPEQALALYAQAIPQLTALNVLHQAAPLLIEQARLLQQQGRSDEALAAAHTAVQLAKQIGQLTTVWEASLVQAHLTYLYVSHDRGWQQLLTLLEQATSLRERAAALYTLWTITASEQLRRSAHALYTTLYATTPLARYRDRLAQLDAHSVP